MTNGSDAARSCDHDQLLLSRVIEAEVVPLPADEVPHAFLCGYEVREPSHVAAGD